MNKGLLLLILACLAILFIADASCIGGVSNCVNSCTSKGCITGYCTPASFPPEKQMCLCSYCPPRFP
jgi:hypothetical protein